jgi:diguanylate cyclase
MRAVGIVMIIWLAMIVAVPVVLDRVGSRYSEAAKLALISGAERTIMRQISGTLDRISQTPQGPEVRAAKIGLRWEVERLIELDAERTALAAPRDLRTPSLTEATADTLDFIADPTTDRQQALALRDLYAARLTPWSERIAAQTESDARWATADARSIVFAFFGFQLAVLLLLVFGVARPARARIAAWVLSTRKIDEEHRFRLLHDPLTQLPNDAYLRAHLTQVVAGADRAATQTAILRINLDKFKSLRDTLGARTSDELLRISARRIRQTLRGGDFAAYLGQDNFVVVAPDLEDANAASGIAHRLQAAMTKPFSLQGGARRVGCSIGVTMLSDDAPNAELALANAEIALAEAQDAGSGCIRYFRESLRQEAERRENLFSELIMGLERGELVPFFQPQIDLATGELSGFEALVRWRHPERGLLSPAAFLDFAESADLTERIGEAVLGNSLAALNAWDSAGLRVPRVGINFAMAELRDPRLVEKIKWEVERNDVDPSRISIEVLETVLIKSDTDLVVRNLRGLASVGFEIELDDFGTGHASIQNLRRFMVDRIKIDRSFVFGIEDSEEQQTLTASMIAMARALGIQTLAEGVETDSAENVLRRLGCDHFQGYLVAKPMAMADTFGWLASFEGRGPRSGAAGLPAAGDPNTT